MNEFKVTLNVRYNEFKNVKQLVAYHVKIRVEK